MRRTIPLVLITATIALAGCQSHEAKVADLQKEYDRLGAQFQKDCSAELLNMPPALSPKCKDEKKKLSDTWNQLQAQRAQSNR
jgi:hypothetical protein